MQNSSQVHLYLFFFFSFKTCWRLFCYHIQHESWSTCDTVATVSVKPMHVWLMLMHRLICIGIYTNMSVEMQGCKTKTCCSACAGWLEAPAHFCPTLFEISLLLTYFVAALSFHFLDNNKNGISCWKVNWIFFCQILSPFTLLDYNPQWSEQKDYIFTNVGGLCPLKTKQSWVIQEKRYCFILHFQFECQVFWRTFMLFWILWATNMVRLLIYFPTPYPWVNHPTEMSFCLRTVRSFSLVLSLEMPTHTWTNDGP